MRSPYITDSFDHLHTCMHAHIPHTHTHTHTEEDSKHTEKEKKQKKLHEIKKYIKLSNSCKFFYFFH